MSLTIVSVGDPVLRRTAHPLLLDELRTPRIRDLIKAMKETMRQAPGVGLAAPQVGESLQLAVIEDRAECPADVPVARWVELERVPVPFHVLVNPVIIASSPRQAAFYEGCLSVPGYRCVVPRALEIEVSCFNDKAEPVTIRAKGWYARILQHEIDHLAGTLYVDRMVSRSLCTAENHDKNWKARPMEEVQQQLGLGGRW